MPHDKRRWQGDAPTNYYDQFIVTFMIGERWRDSNPLAISKPAIGLY
jgi:hypothetical protein